MPSLSAGCSMLVVALLSQGIPGATFDSLGIVIIRVCLAAWAPSTLVDRLGEIDEQKMQVAR